MSADTLAGKMFIVYIMVLGLSVVCWYRRVEPVRWGILLVFLLLAARHLRNIPLFLIVSLPLLAELLDTCAQTGSSPFPIQTGVFATMDGRRHVRLGPLLVVCRP